MQSIRFFQGLADRYRTHAHPSTLSTEHMHDDMALVNDNTPLNTPFASVCHYKTELW